MRATERATERRVSRIGTMLAVTALACAVNACARVPEVVPPTPPGPGEAARHRAALATLRVDNRTGQRLTVIYRPAADAGGTVAVGSVPPRAVATMAPVPAGEPIVLMVRTDTGRSHRLAPRTLEVDQLWTWVVPANTVFTDPE